jgi:hypothetical protein
MYHNRHQLFYFGRLHALLNFQVFYVETTMCSVYEVIAKLIEFQAYAEKTERDVDKFI